MKTNSLRKSSRPRGRYGAYAAAAAAVLVLMFGFLFGGATERAVQFILSPFWKGGLAIEGSVSDFFSVFFYKQAVFDENAKLRDEITDLQSKLLEEQPLRTENEQLSSMLGRMPRGNVAVAAVILRPPEIPYDSFVLDLGAAEGIQAGNIVLASDGAYLGTITETFSNTSKASLASSPGVETKARLGNTPMSFIGKGGGSYEGRVPQAVAVAENDPAYAVPSDYVLGRVAEIATESNNAYRKVTLRSTANLSEERYVFILKAAQ